MSDTQTPAKPSTEIAERSYCTKYTAVVIYDGQLVMNARFPHASARRDAVVELLIQNHNEVHPSRVDAILAPYGGADADAALERIIQMYAEHGVDIDVYLKEEQVDIGPARLYVTFTDYGDGTTSIEQYTSQQERRQSLYDLMSDFYESVNGSPLPHDLTEEELVLIMNTLYLRPTRGRVHLLEAQRNGDRDVFIS